MLAFSRRNFPKHSRKEKKKRAQIPKWYVSEFSTLIDNKTRCLFPPGARSSLSSDLLTVFYNTCRYLITQWPESLLKEQVVKTQSLNNLSCSYFTNLLCFPNLPMLIVRTSFRAPTYCIMSYNYFAYYIIILK